MTSDKRKRLTAKQRDVLRDRAFLQALIALDTCCMRCDYDEAEGALVNHCDACCRKIVRALWLIRENARRRIYG